MILDTLAASSRKRVETEKLLLPKEEIIARALALPKGDFAFAKAIDTPELSFICEVKKASPSKGLLSPGFPYLSIAMEYERAGAAAVSVLTEPEYFLGSDTYLREIRSRISLPLLRKDFTVDSYQIYQAKTLGASAVLLICSLLDTDTLAEYLEICGNLGMDALVEAHDEGEIVSAIKAGAKIIGINNRNLKNFQVDFSNSLRLRALVPPSVLFVAESGIRDESHIRLLYKAGVNAVLIGETLMKSDDKKAALDRLRRGIHE